MKGDGRMAENHDKQKDREKISRRGLVWGLCTVAAAVTLVLGISMFTGQDQGGARGENVEDMLTAQGEMVTQHSCVLEQTYRFAPCGHTVTRRLQLPDSLTGADFDQVQHYYHQWTVDAFSPYSVVLSRDETIYCPMHQVLMTDETGYLSVFQNVYGDGLAFLERLEYTAADFDEEHKAQLFTGMGFDTREDLDAWIGQHKKGKS